MNDLLGGDTRGRYRPQPDENDDDLEVQMATRSSNDTGMTGFYEEIGDIKNEMQLIRRNLQKLQAANEETKLVTRAKDMKALRQKMEADVAEVLKIAKAIKAKVERLDRANLENRRAPNCGEGTPTDRTRMSITNTTKKKLKDMMDDFQELREKIQAEYREVVERRYKTVTGQDPDEQVVDKLIDSGDAEEIFRKAIQEQGRGKVLETLNEIQERSDAVKDIEKQLLEVHQIFMDMATLVEAQGELVDNIEASVGQAVVYTKAGTKQLEKARWYQLSTRKWIACGVVTLLIIIAVVVVVAVQPWKTSSS